MMRETLGRIRGIANIAENKKSVLRMEDASCNPQSPGRQGRNRERAHGPGPPPREMVWPTGPRGPPGQGLD